MMSKQKAILLLPGVLFIWCTSLGSLLLSLGCLGLEKCVVAKACGGLVTAQNCIFKYDSIFLPRYKWHGSVVSHKDSSFAIVGVLPTFKKPVSSSLCCLSAASLFKAVQSPHMQKRNYPDTAPAVFFSSLSCCDPKRNAWGLKLFSSSFFCALSDRSCSAS